ncbi:hypothetical protein GCM10010402_27240 [Actinomadura luteofluorescens]
MFTSTVAAWAGCGFSTDMSTESRSDASTAPVLNMTFFLPFGADVSANNLFEGDLLSIGG